MVRWLKEHANGRLIIDVGCGQGHLVNMLKREGARAMGIEPNFDKTEWLKWRMLSGGDIDVNEILEGRVEDTFNKKLIESLGKDQVMLVSELPFMAEEVPDAE
jgi:16S rRNA A1518/A1519 N6-dimethyltransferase RsmA/KsgA/DIM1 with predicted DNA glycosylase/AP lyase activity